jgi:ABC-type spermidine/putrescine transport system permease subunit I
MGGPGDIMIAMLIEREVELTYNWPTAALMTIVLLTVTLVLYAFYARIADLGEGAR